MRLHKVTISQRETQIFYDFYFSKNPVKKYYRKIHDKKKIKI